jgi:hypothetical protein
MYMSKITRGGYMPDGQRRESHMITIDGEVWRKFKEYAHTMDISPSRLIEIMARGQVAAQEKGINEVIKGMMTGFLDADKSLSIEDKLKMQDLLEGNEKVLPKKSHHKKKVP